MEPTDVDGPVLRLSEWAEPFFAAKFRRSYRYTSSENQSYGTLARYLADEMKVDQAIPVGHSEIGHNLKCGLRQDGTSQYACNFTNKIGLRDNHELNDRASSTVS